jgi:hypothetical protein
MLRNGYPQAVQQVLSLNSFVGMDIRSASECNILHESKRVEREKFDVFRHLLIFALTSAMLTGRRWNGVT